MNMLKQLIAYYKKMSTEEWVWFFIWFSLPISIKFNSLAIVLGGIIITVLFLKTPSRIRSKQILFYIIPFLFFGIHAMGAFDGSYTVANWRELEQMLPFLVIPLLFILGSIRKEEFTQVSLFALVLSLIISGLIMIVQSIMVVVISHDWYGLVYHQFVLPMQSGAIYHSLFLLVAIIQINEIVILEKHRRVKYLVVTFFLIMLFLSASKLILGIGIPILILKYRKEVLFVLKRRKILIPILGLLAIIVLIPVGLRVVEISKPNFDIVFAKQYRYDSPLNGLNLRLIQSRFGFEILNKSDAWVNGVGINNSQNLLDNLYIKYGLYTGYEGTDDTGYLNYNFHNQFVETLVRSGVIGLILLVMMLILLTVTKQSYLFVSKWVVLVIVMLFLTESVLERQLGIVYFCLIYSSCFIEQTKLNSNNGK